jgi:hypothetical protein
VAQSHVLRFVESTALLEHGRFASSIGKAYCGSLDLDFRTYEPSILLLGTEIQRGFAALFQAAAQFPIDPASNSSF